MGNSTVSQSRLPEQSILISNDKIGADKVTCPMLINRLVGFINDQSVFAEAVSCGRDPHAEGREASMATSFIFTQAQSDGRQRLLCCTVQKTTVRVLVRP